MAAKLITKMMTEHNETLKLMLFHNVPHWLDEDVLQCDSSLIFPLFAYHAKYPALHLQFSKHS